MKIKTATLLIAAIAAFSINSALADGHSASAIKTASSSKGNVFTDSHGMTLYTFAKDKSGKSNCNGGCAEKWPPMMAEKAAKAEGDFTIVKRDDGMMQWAHKGMPLYTWFKDKAKGDIIGDGVKGVWNLARP